MFEPFAKCTRLIIDKVSSIFIVRILYGFIETKITDKKVSTSTRKNSIVTAKVFTIKFHVYCKTFVHFLSFFLDYRSESSRQFEGFEEKNLMSHVLTPHINLLSLTRYLSYKDAKMSSPPSLIKMSFLNLQNCKIQNHLDFMFGLYSQRTEHGIYYIHLPRLSTSQ